MNRSASPPFFRLCRNTAMPFQNNKPFFANDNARKIPSKLAQKKPSSVA